MLKLVGLLALVLIAMKVTSNPKFWHWMFPPQAEQRGGAGDKAARKDSDPKEIDFGVRFDDEDPLKPGEFRSRLKPEAGGHPRDNAAPSPESPRREEAELPADAQDFGFEIEKIDEIDKIDKKILAPVRDNTLGIRHHEADAFYAILARARGVPLNDLERAARNDVGFTVLMQESDHFRGRLLTVNGDMKRLSKLPAVRNRHGIEEVYEAWLFTRDSGNNPYRIVCTGIPDGIPQGEEIEQRVEVRATGYFFKREGYEARGGLHTAPVLLAKRLRWFRPRAGKTEGLGLAPYILGVVVLVGSALALTLWRFRVSDKRFHTHQLKRIMEAPREAIEALDGVETTDVNEMFRELAERERAAELSESAGEGSGIEER